MKNGLIIDQLGKRYFLNDLIHREDGPAVEYSNGGKEWWLHNQLHREDGPAIEYLNGDKTWWINGKLHRENGPAVEFANGDKWYYLNHINLSEEDYFEEIKKTKSLNFIIKNYISKSECRNCGRSGWNYLPYTSERNPCDDCNGSGHIANGGENNEK
jgi:hypothetical protein